MVVDAKNLDWEQIDLSVNQKAVLNYWQSKKKGTLLPSRENLDILDIYKEMPNVVIFDILSDPLDFKYRLVGTVVTENSFNDFTGKTLLQMEGKGPGSKIWNMLDAVRVEKKEIYKEVPYVGPKEYMLRSTLIFLPLVDEVNEVNMILLVAEFHSLRS